MSEVKDTNFEQVMKIAVRGRSLVLKKFVRTSRGRLSTIIETLYQVRMVKGLLPDGDVSYTTPDAREARNEVFRYARILLKGAK